MIIETFGPPGAGKTTFTEALARRLREQGYVVDLMLTLPRTQSRWVAFGGVIPAIARVIRAFAADATLLWHRSDNKEGLRLARDLLRLMPPKHIIWRIRLSQYVMRFSCVWVKSFADRQRDSHHIVIFDQGFVQVACTLALFSAAERQKIEQAMLMRMRPDILVRLDAPIELLAKRLCQRTDEKPFMEKWFEADVKTFLAAKPVVDYVDFLVSSGGDTIVRVNSLDETRLRDAVEAIEKAIAARITLDARGHQGRDAA